MMQQLIKFFLCAVLVFVFNTQITADTTDGLHAEHWELSRSGEALVNIAVIKNIVNQWQLKPLQRIELHYPGGEEGELWVEELRDWLVSLGIPSKNIVVVPGSGVEDVIKLYVVRKGESYQ